MTSLVSRLVMVKVTFQSYNSLQRSHGAQQRHRYTMCQQKGHLAAGSDCEGRDTGSVVVVSLVDSQHRDANVVECTECSGDLISVVVCDVIFIERLFTEVGINLCRRRWISFLIRCIEFDCVDTGLELTVERIASNRNIDAVCKLRCCLCQVLRSRCRSKHRC